MVIAVASESSRRASRFGIRISRSAGRVDFSAEDITTKKHPPTFFFHDDRTAKQHHN